MSRWFTGFVGAVLEAWQELRIHRTRVLLSLIGVAVAVCSLTTVMGLGAIMQQATTEMNERSSGRPATLFVSAYSEAGQIDDEAMRAAWDEVVARYDIQYATRVVWDNVPVDSAQGVLSVSTMGVDEPYGTMHRIRLVEGSWFTAEDAAMLAPRVIVNEVFWDRLGRPPLDARPALSLGGPDGTTAIVVGVTPASTWETEPSMTMLADHLAAFRAAGAASAGEAPVDPMYGAPSPQYEMWVPPETWEPLADAVRRDIGAALGDGVQADVSRQDAAQYGNDAYVTMQLIIGGIAMLVLLLGALGLLNIALVTVKQRVREIGIRRSFGATAGRVFFSVMMESVVATVAAGVVGVAAAILIVQSPLLRDLIGQGVVTDFPPFPVEAAIAGLAAASIVGALAGLLPALVAVRVKVIDAIRY